MRLEIFFFTYKTEVMRGEALLAVKAADLEQEAEVVLRPLQPEVEGAAHVENDPALLVQPDDHGVKEVLLPGAAVHQLVDAHLGDKHYISKLYILIYICTIKRFYCLLTRIEGL